MVSKFVRYCVLVQEIRVVISQYTAPKITYSVLRLAFGR